MAYATAPTKPLNQLALLLIITAAALAIGSLTPWVTIIGIGLSGVSIHYGIVSLVTAAAVGILVYLRSTQPGSHAARVGAIVVAVGGALSIASAIYVGWAIRSSFGSGDDDNDLAEAFVNALSPGIGIGLWLVLAGGIAALVLSVPLALDRTMSRGPW
jgi:hypothetical protein